MQLFFVVNQQLLDGSAHALYCFRHCWWLARTRPEQAVRLVHPGSTMPAEAVRHFGLDPLPNLHLVGLPALRRARGHRGVTINLVYYWALARYLRRESQPGDWLFSASFPKMIDFLLGRRGLRTRLRWGYEVHDLLELAPNPPRARVRCEREILTAAQCLVTTTTALETPLRARFPTKPVLNLGLACGFSAEHFPAPKRSEREFRLAYVGSVYPEQGIEWLIEHWRDICAAQPVRVPLRIAGGTEAQAARLRALSAQHNAPGLAVVGSVPPAQLPEFLREVDGLVLPALPEGRMPYVALTKAYDYLGLNRPVLASVLPTISEVMRPRQEALPFAAGDAVSLGSALRELIGDPKLGQHLVARAGQRAAELSWPARAGRWWAMLDRL